MKKIRIFEWNLNQRSSGKTLPNYVIKSITKKKPDIIVLIEFKYGKNNINKNIMENTLKNYAVYSYNGTSGSGNKKKNGILIALNRHVFQCPAPNDFEFEASTSDTKDIAEPNWLAVTCTLDNGQKLDIIGVRVTMGSDRSRTNQIEWILKHNNNNSNKKILIGDFNYGPHKKEYLPGTGKNWEDIINLAKDLGYLEYEAKNNQHAYSPNGFSWKNETLDWVFTKGISVIRHSDYNNFDWSFGHFIEEILRLKTSMTGLNTVNLPNYEDGYFVPEGFFIKNDPGYPDHAIFTVEVQLEEEI